jgi:putative flippase GtrA
MQVDPLVSADEPCPSDRAPHLHPLALTIMYTIGVLAHFPSNRWITYRAQDRPWAPQACRYAAMLVWNLAAMQALAALASRASLSPYIAVTAATGLNMIPNFLFMTDVVFAKERAR